MGFLDATNNLSQLFYLLCGHALADYVWQPPEMAERKQPWNLSSSDEDTYGPWWWWMTAHSLINGLVVGFIMHWWVLGLLETIVHFGADYAKSTQRITTNQDQAIHLGSKVLWTLLG